MFARAKVLNLAVVMLLAFTTLIPCASVPVGSLPVSDQNQASQPVPHPAAAQDEAATQAHLGQVFGQLPLYFVENQGQMDEQVAYTVQGSDKTIYFTSEGVTFALTAPLTQTAANPAAHTASLRPVMFGADRETPPERQRWIVKLDFVGANPNVRPVGEDRTGAVISYFRGPQDQWHTGLPTYSRIVYPDLWPGIDLVYYGTVNRLKYEFIVHPGADPAQIRLAYRGAEVALNAAGQLEVTAPAGGFSDDTPVAYQVIGGQRVTVTAAYDLSLTPDQSEAASYIFRLGSYDPTRPLVLDPAVLVYCGYIGGSGSDKGFDIAVDSTGNAYVTGYTYSDATTFPVAVGPDLAHSGSNDAFVAKVNAAGTALVYAGYIGGSEGDIGEGIAVDNLGNAYITGATTSANFPIKVGPGLIFNSGNDAFVAKITTDGTDLVYAGYIGGSDSDVGYGIAVDEAGDAYITGSTSSDESEGFPVTVGPDLTFNGVDGAPDIDAFVAKVNATGGLVYAGYIGGARDDGGRDIAVDSAGNAYVAGDTGSSQAQGFPLTVGPDLTYNGNVDAFVAKVSVAGTGLVYCGYIGGSESDIGYGIAVDGAGSAYVMGLTGSTETQGFPLAVGPDLTYNGGGDVFVAKVNPSGTGLAYAGYIGGSASDIGWDIAIDSTGNAYVAGQTHSTEATFPVTVGPDLTYNGGNGDAFVARVNAAGTGLVYAGYIGGSSGTELAYGIAVDGTGNAYVTGFTASTEAQGFPVTVGPDLTNNGGEDVFVAKVGIDCDSTADIDGDGLLDGWEACGYDADGDGIIDVDLPAMHADPYKKDVFVEIDYMIDHGVCQPGLCSFGHSHRPDPQARDQVIQAFAGAPVLNPDGSTGITLHIEISQEIPHQDTLQPIGETWDWSAFDRIKNNQGYFDPNRARIFHYVIFAHALGGNIPLGTSGVSRGIPGSDFAVTLGRWTDGVGSVSEQAGTLMHELGHNLGLRHGGDDYQNYEPNYLSVMNYSFQTSGLIVDGSDGHLDYSRFGTIPPLNEHHLTETVGLNGGPATEGYGTRYYCRPGGAWQECRVTDANGPIDWDCSGNADGVDIQANINDGISKETDTTISTLTGFSDWPALVFDGGDVGPDMNSSAQTRLVSSSVLTEELTFEIDSQFYRPYRIAFSGGGDVMASLGITTTTFITLTNLGALTATVPISYVPGDGWFDLSSVPVSVTLSPSATLSIPITLTVPASRSGAISDSASISATIQESPLMGDWVELSARIGPLARFVAEPVRGSTLPFTVTFTDASVGRITTWQWDFGNGITSTLPSPTHAYTAGGVYTVTLTVSGPDGSDTEVKPRHIAVERHVIYLPLVLRSY